jgi:mannose-6-phosphate isomerase
MDNTECKLSQRPITLKSNRVWRTYLGGKKLEEWRGDVPGRDGEFPEEWVASVVNARNVGRENFVDEGLSEVKLATVETVTLKAMIHSDPEAFLGKNHVRKYGSHTAVLVKILDSYNRLSIQVHPDRQFARDVFHSPFGKTEAWYVLGGREINGESPYLLFGFKPGITREKWRKLFERQDVDGMIACLHRIPVVPGSMLLIEGGLPHAIGPGCFLVEVQEPTDYTIRVERINAEGKLLPDEQCHQGIGFERIFDCFHYNGYSREETLRRWRISPQILQEGDGFRLTELVGGGHTDKFGLQRLEITTGLECRSNDVFSILVVLSGSGRIMESYGETPLHQASLIFLPARLDSFRIESQPEQPLVLLRCYPPQ